MQMAANRFLPRCKKRESGRERHSFCKCTGGDGIEFFLIFARPECARRQFHRCPFRAGGRIRRSSWKVAITVLLENAEQDISRSLWSDPVVFHKNAKTYLAEAKKWARYSNLRCTLLSNGLGRGPLIESIRSSEALLRISLIVKESLGLDWKQARAE